jgi:diguanylate cyclase (GGDEF)-like protein
MTAITILNVEDDDDAADLLAHALENLKSRAYSIRRARSLAEFETLFAEAAPDIVLLDLHLPDSKGLDTVHKVLARIDGGVPVLVLTGSTDTGIGLKAVEAGAQDFLPKSEMVSPLLGRAIDFSIQRGRAIHQAKQTAMQDSLTGIGNRAFFNQSVEAAIGRAQRHGNLFALAYIDLDGFKAINDTKGHAAGDEVLKEVARRCKKCARVNDLVCRLGGDEFVIMLDNILTLGKAFTAAKHYSDAIEKPITLSTGDTVSVGASLGVALCPEDGFTAEKLTEVADSRMYQAKAARKRKTGS